MARCPRSRRRRTVVHVIPGGRCDGPLGVDDESRAVCWREPAALRAAGPTTLGGGGHGGASPSRVTSPQANGGGRHRPAAVCSCAHVAPLDGRGSIHDAVAWSVACPRSPSSLRIAAPSPSSATLTRARPPSPRSSCCTAGRCRRPVRSRPGVSDGAPGPTGWSSSRSGASRSRPRCCSSRTTTTCSTCSTRRVTATSPRTPTACWPPSTPRSWCSTRPRASRPRRSSCSRSAGRATSRCSRSSTSGTAPAATASSCSTRSRSGSTSNRSRSRGRSATPATSGG